MTALISISCGMDRPQPQSHMVTPKEGHHLKVEIHRVVQDAIYGSDEEKCQSLPHNHPLLQASPRSYIAGVRILEEKKFEDRLRKKGLTPEMVKEWYGEAEKVIAQECDAIPQFPVDSPLKQEFAAVAKKMGVSMPHVKIAELDNPAQCMGSSVLVDPGHMAACAPTPKRRAVIVGHELRHHHHHDYRTDIATSMARDVAQVDLSPTYFRHKSRCNEVFADLEPAALDPAWADDFQRLSQQRYQEDGPGEACSHPSRAQRKRMSELMVDLHGIHPQGKVPRTDDPRPDQSGKENRRINRNLMQEFELLEQFEHLEHEEQLP